MLEKLLEWTFDFSQNFSCGLRILGKIGLNNWPDKNVIIDLRKYGYDFTGSLSEIINQDWSIISEYPGRRR